MDASLSHTNGSVTEMAIGAGAVLDRFMHNHGRKAQLSDFDCVDVYRRNRSKLDWSLLEDDTALALCHMNIALWNAVPPLYLLVGTFSNVLSIIIWSKKKLAQQTQHVSTMLMWLAIFDLSVLYTGLVKHYLKKSTFRWDIQDGNEVICKFHEFLIYCSLSCASWVVAFVAVDRCACILCAHPQVRDHAIRLMRRLNLRGASASSNVQKRKCPLTRRPNSLHLAVAILMVISVSANLHIFWTQKIINGGCKHSSEEYANFLHYVRPKFDLFFAGILPIVVVIVSTSLLICTICCCFRRSQPADKDKDKNKQKHVCSGSKSDATADVTVAPLNRKKVQSAVSKMSNRITWTLISIATCFILCNVPARIYLMLYPTIPAEARAVPGLYFKYRFTFSVLALLQFLANVINFFIYSAGNELFRKEVRELLFKNCKVTR